MAASEGRAETGGTFVMVDMSPEYIAARESSFESLAKEAFDLPEYSSNKLGLFQKVLQQVVFALLCEDCAHGIENLWKTLEIVFLEKKAPPLFIYTRKRG